MITSFNLSCMPVCLVPKVGKFLRGLAFKACIVFLSILATATISNACNLSNITLVGTPIDNGAGTYDITIEVCIGVSENWGATNDFTLTPAGGTFTNIVSLTTTTINNTYDYGAFEMVDCIVMGGPCALCCVSCLGPQTDGVTTTATGSIMGGSTVTFTQSGSIPPGFDFSPDDNATFCASSPPPSQF